MKVTKYGHSCVLVEANDNVVLFDPGNWSAYTISSLPLINWIVYTHEHGDHFDTEKLKELLTHSPDAEVICGDDIKVAIAAAGIEAAVHGENQRIVKFESPHEDLPIPGVAGPAQNGYHFDENFRIQVTASLFAESKKVLAMGFGWPWGSFRAGLDKVIELKPSYVLPIHDWHFSDEGRAWNLELIREVLKKEGITTLDSTSGITHQID